MRSTWALLALAACAGGAPPPRYPAVEAGRKTAPWLVADAETGSQASRVRALHALGRIADEPAKAELEKVLGGAAAEDVLVAAVEGLWFADAGGPAVAAAYGRAGPFLDVAVVRALGRLAGAAEMPVIARALADPRPAVRAAAGVAAGVAGRRKLTYSPAIRRELEAGLTDADPAVRTGAAYGIAYEPKGAPASRELLVALAAVDSPPEARALVEKALGQRGARVDVLQRGLADVDVWVRVEAARALAGPNATPDMRHRLARWLEAEWIAGAAGASLHPIVVGLGLLATRTTDTEIGDAFQRIHDAVPRAPRQAADVVACMSAAGLVDRGASLELVARCGGSPTEGWPLWARRRVLAQALRDGTDVNPAERRATLVSLAADPDERVRAAVPEAAVLFLPDAEAERALRAEIADPSVAVAEAACDALADQAARAPAWAGPALLAIAPRAEREPELHQSLLDALVALHVDAREVFERALADPVPAVRQKAAEGLTKLGRRVPAASPPPPKLPPIDLGEASGRPTLVVSTTQGTFHVELAPDVAPWNVATLVTLARRHFFDGTFWHRVVPGFVVQGGDPTGTGAGGPGFTVFAEPSALPFRRGTVGIADAGKDTGGSQWFVMHAAAPHLDGRYTVVGQVPETDMAVVDKLVVGDRILRVEVGP